MGRKGRNRSKMKSDNKSTYFKVLATFQCSNGDCRRSWHSAHAWGKDEELDDNCEYCGTPAKLMDAKDEMVILDTYTCPKSNCGAQWQSLHFGERVAHQCDCGTVVLPAANPQERFARHYVFKCKGKSCTEKPEWEDHSTTPQKTQRCTVCRNRGDIKRIQKMKPYWLIKKLQEEKGGSGSGGGGGGKGAIDGPRISGFGSGKGPSKHNSEFCDMCQSMIRQGYRSCHRYRKVVTEQTISSTGALIERFVNLELK